MDHFNQKWQIFWVQIIFLHMAVDLWEWAMDKENIWWEVGQVKITEWWCNEVDKEMEMDNDKEMDKEMDKAVADRYIDKNKNPHLGDFL